MTLTETIIFVIVPTRKHELKPHPRIGVGSPERPQTNINDSLNTKSLATQDEAIL